MQRELTIIPRATIHPNKICVFNEYKFTPTKPKRSSIQSLFCADANYIKNFKDSTRTSNGIISKLTRKKIEKCLDYLLLLSKNQKTQQTANRQTAKFCLTFITLTLPSKQIHTDNELKNKCLNSFLLEIKKYYQVHNFIWRAEKQENGNIHFHVVTDKFIPWSEMRSRWNRIVNKLGYVDRYREQLKAYHSCGFKVRKDLLAKWSYKSQIRAYELGKANDYNNPNSTDIHSIKKVSNTKAYISKYVTKNPEKLETMTKEQKDKLLVKGRLWSSSQELSNIKGAQIELDSHSTAELEKITKDSGAYTFSGDYFKVIYIDFQDLAKYGATDLYHYFTGYLYEKFHYSAQLTFNN